MATRIEHRATFEHTAAAVFAAQTDRQALQDRLERVGGERAELRDHELLDDGARYTLLQAIPADKLPSLVRNLHSGELTVRRRHTWTSAGADRYTGTVTVEVADLPGRIAADVELTPSGDGCVQLTRGEVAVRVPLVGGKIETFVAGEVTKLLATEADATARWLAR